jgi:DNA-binding response OmpR family regulator
LQLKVTDTGIGIEKDKQEQIFKRFFQTEIPDTLVNQGSGIGLAITNEFVKLHNGEIFVESEPGKGTTFIVLFPLMPVKENTVQSGEHVTDDRQTEINLQEEMNTLPAPGKPGLKKTILLVEDNDDFRFYIKDNLRHLYNVAEAENGKAGWQKTLSAHPDLVVCDISMPGMNGIDLCKKIKADSRTSFIPVILLTALSGDEQQLSGLETGASDYITKPFNFEILLSKIRNQLVQQESFKKTYQKQVQVNASEVITESADEKFIQNALAVVEKNISDPDFSVEELSRLLFLSRVAVYKKLFALTGKTPLEFIRSVRIKRSAQLLEKNELTVAEVAYEVGFNNPKNFSKYFKAEYNVLPSAYATRNKGGDKKKDPE